VENYLGDHVQPVLLLLAPLYRHWPDLRLLLIVQAIALSLGALPVYRIARRKLENPLLAMAFSLASLLYPAINFVNRFDFHAIAFTIPLFLFAVESLETGRNRLASVLLLVALICKENAGLTVFALGLYVALARKQRRLRAL
jgi:uncharacterized membrane protein